jgi:hypothetical protein
MFPGNLRSALIVLLALSGAPVFAQKPTPAYLDPAQPQAARIQNLVSRLTLEAIVSVMSDGTLAGTVVVTNTGASSADLRQPAAVKL